VRQSDKYLVDVQQTMICYPIRKLVTFFTPRRGEQCLICRLHAVAWGASFDWFVPCHGVDAPRRGVEPPRRVLDGSL